MINQAGGNSSQFWYGADRRRFKQLNVEGAVTTTTIYAGRLFEKVTVGTTTDYKHFVPTGGVAVPVHIRSTSGSNATYYLLSDHLGSVDKITNSSGGVAVALSYDSFGKRRGANWVGTPSSGDWTQIAATTRYGFTEHEHLDNLALIHMNGRVNDPAIGRFIQADPYIQAPFDGQSLNRYSYVSNNPLSSIDPSGFCGATAITLWITEFGRRTGENFGSNQPSFNVPCPDMWWTLMNPGAMSRGWDARNSAGNPSLPGVFRIPTHNHPSGMAEPSQADELITQRLKEALALVDIRLLDHLIVGDGSCVSFAEKGLL